MIKSHLYMGISSGYIINDSSILNITIEDIWVELRMEMMISVFMGN